MTVYSSKFKNLALFLFILGIITTTSLYAGDRDILFKSVEGMPADVEFKINADTFTLRIDPNEGDPFEVDGEVDWQGERIIFTVDLKDFDRDEYHINRMVNDSEERTILVEENQFIIPDNVTQLTMWGIQLERK